MKTRARIYAVPNGVGLSRDLDHLRELLEGEGIAVEHADPRRNLARGPVDLAFHLEHLQLRELKSARVNVWSPNPEWCTAPTLAVAIQRAGEVKVMAKTRHTARLFDQMGFDSRFVGWAVQPMGLPMPAADRFSTQFLHVAGKSKMKGTGQVMEAAKLLQGTGIRVVIYSAAKPAAKVLPGNLTWHLGWHSAETIAEAQRRHLFHLCPSLAEGYGHYLHEARALGSIVLTTDAEPMNEAEGVIKVPPREGPRHNLVNLQLVDPRHLAEGMKALASMPIEELQRISTEARTAYVADERDHRERFAQALAAWMPR